MPSKPLSSFFGDNLSTSDNLLTIDVAELMANVTGTYHSYDVASSAPEQIVSALLAYWHQNNYVDSVTGIRLSADKTVSLVSGADTIRRALVSRGDETQVKHDFTFSVYTQDYSSFNPENLV